MDTCPNLTLYRANDACSFVPHALLNELEIPFDTVLLDFKDGKMRSVDGSFTPEEFRKTHPKGYVPALSIGGTIITEFPAICAFVGSLKPEYQLFGQTALERAKVDEWMAWLSGTLHGYGFAMLWQPQRFTEVEDPVIRNAITDRGFMTLLECFERIETRIGTEYAVGSVLTVVDFALYIFWRWGSLRIGLKDGYMEKHYPRYTKVAEGIEKRKSIVQTIATEGLPPAFS